MQALTRSGGAAPSWARRPARTITTTMTRINSQRMQSTINERESRAKARLNASGCSRLARCPARGITTSSACGKQPPPSSATRPAASACPPRRRPPTPGHRALLSVANDSGRSIIRITAPRIAGADCCLMSRRIFDSMSGCAPRASSCRAASASSRAATPTGAFAIDHAPACVRRLARPSDVSAPARVSASTIARARCGALPQHRKRHIPAHRAAADRGTPDAELLEQRDHIGRVIVHRRRGRTPDRCVDPPNPRRSGAIRRQPGGSALNCGSHIEAARGKAWIKATTLPAASAGEESKYAIVRSPTWKYCRCIPPRS